MDLLKVLLNTSYCLGILTAYPVEFPSALSPVLQVGRAISALQSDALSVDCLVSDVFLGSKYLLKIVFALLMPLGGIVISGILWTIIYVCLARKVSQMKKGGRSRRRRRRGITAKDPAQLRRFVATNFAVTAIIVFFVTLPSLSRTASSMMVCTSFGVEGGELRLQNDPEVICWEKEHLAYFFAAALPAHALFTVGVPLLGIVTLRRHAREDRLWKSASEDPAANILLFVYSGFERNRYYWEFLVFARKVALGLVVVVTTDAQVSGLLGLVILQTASVLQLYGKPYRHPVVNLAESGALFATSLAVYIGLFHFVSGGNENGALTVVLPMVVAGFFTVYLCLLMCVILHHKCPSVTQRCPIIAATMDDTKGGRDGDAGNVVDDG